MTDNKAGWRQPVSDRLGKTGGYPGENGFGHEDWNFSRNVWKDGLCHLYVRSEPAAANRKKTFNIVLGPRTSGGHFAVGFCENATYAIAELDEDLTRKRAEHLHALDLSGDLRGTLHGLPVKQKAKRLMADGEVYWVSVKQADLVAFHSFVPIPEVVVKKSYSRYGLIRLDKEDYDGIRNAPKVTGR